MIDLTAKTFCAFGLRQSGKSTLFAYILNEYGLNACIYDTLGEAPHNAPYAFFDPKSARYDTAMLEQFIRNWIIPKGQESPRFDLFCIDEANRFCPPKPSPLPAAIAQLNDEGRHYPMSIGYIARRPCQINQDLTELADYLFIFRLTGKADIKWLNDTVEGLGDVVKGLEKHHFVLLHPNRTYEICAPIKPPPGWLEKAAQRRKR